MGLIKSVAISCSKQKPMRKNFDSEKSVKGAWS